MMNQYHAQRSRSDSGSLRIGTIPVGTVLYIRDTRNLGIVPSRSIRRDPWIVTAWLNREYYPCSRKRPPVVYMIGGHLAVVKSLRTGAEKRVSDHILLACSDAGLEVFNVAL